MDTDLKVTDQPEEIAFDDIVAGDNIVNIPLFQRAYKWTEKNLIQFWDDIDSIIDGSSRSHFLGVLVLVPQSRRVGQPVVLDIVDGQQRLTTCYLSILSMVQAAAEAEHTQWALEVARGFLLTRKFSNFSTNTKLVPSATDRQQFHSIWSRISNLKQLEGADWSGEPPSPPQPSGETAGRMSTAYKSLLKRSKFVLESEGLEGLERVFEIIVGRLSFVTINLRSPTAAPAIFERLNARGEKINISDLVRNEVFARVAEDPMKAQSIFETHWEPFVDKFRRHGIDLEKLLFPYGLTIDPQITKADLFQALRNSWGEGEDPRSIIRALDEHTACLFALENGDVSAYPRGPLRDGLLNLNLLGAPSSVYAFLFHLTKAVAAETLSEKKAAEIISLIESFLFRRAICGIEPTGLHAVFKGLWQEIVATSVSVESVRTSIARRTTVPWPGNDDFVQAIVRNPLYGRRVAKYAIRQYELAAKGETPNDDFEIEHIYPKQPSTDWTIPSSEDVDRIRDTWGNLLPLTSAMNPSIGNSGYLKKRAEYRRAVFASSRDVADKFEDWTLDTIEERSAFIAKWAVTRWPYTRTVTS
tara:strand:- start:326 stop:2080 length:1755 start_codon:yes stop_codon:yes gene_type:complete